MGAHRDVCIGMDLISIIKHKECRMLKLKKRTVTVLTNDEVSLVSGGIETMSGRCDNPSNWCASGNCTSDWCGSFGCDSDGCVSNICDSDGTCASYNCNYTDVCP